MCKKQLPTILTCVVILAVGFAANLSGSVAFAENKTDRTKLSQLNQQDTFSKLIREVVKVVRPAVVEVRVTKRLKYSSPFGDMDDFIRRFFGDDPFGPRRQRPEREYLQRGLGSGVIVDAAKGYVLTNYHVVGGADEVEVVLADERTLRAEVIGKDGFTDLAVIKISPDNLVEAPLGDSDEMEVGDWVLAIGSPRGYAQTVTSGIISAKGRKNGTIPYQKFLQTDAAINRGNSGGPLVNLRGEVIGINTAISSASGGSEGIGFAIPSNLVKKVMDQLIEKGKVVRAFLGVWFQDVDAELAESFGLPAAEGALVTEVTKGSAAEKGGIEVGDVIVSIAGEKIKTGEDLFSIVAGLSAEKEIDVELYRDGEKTTLPVKLGTRKDEFAGKAIPQEEEENITDFGIEVTTVTDRIARQMGFRHSIEGVVVVQVDKGADAAEKGLTRGLVITHVDGKAIATAQEFRQALQGRKNADGVRLRVLTPEGRKRFYFIKPTK